MYFNQGNPLHKIVFENKEIIFSSKTKSFFHLLNKKQNKNLKKKICRNCQKCIFKWKRYLWKPIFNKNYTIRWKKGRALNKAYKLIIFIFDIKIYLDYA